MTRPASKLAPETEVFSSQAYRIQAMVDGLDQVAVVMERKWGVGRLRLIVSDFLRAKFDEQKDRLDAAIQSGEENYVRIHCDGMKRAWSTLDRAAHDAGRSHSRPRSGSACCRRPARSSRSFAPRPRHTTSPASVVSSPPTRSRS
jgi:hypothetical protein